MKQRDLKEKIIPNEEILYSDLFVFLFVLKGAWIELSPKQMYIYFWVGKDGGIWRKKYIPIYYNTPRSPFSMGRILGYVEFQPVGDPLPIKNLEEFMVFTRYSPYDWENPPDWRKDFLDIPKQGIGLYDLVPEKKITKKILKKWLEKAIKEKQKIVIT